MGGLELVKFGITLGALNPTMWLEAAVAADRLGFESVWLSDHVILPYRLEGELHRGSSASLKSQTPVFDPIVTAAHISALAPNIRMGSFVYLLGLRHPFITARAWATLDVLSGGRVTVGAGAGWLTSEWDALGIDPRLRGERLDEAIAICRSLWTEDAVTRSDGFFPFERVAFEPKPVQRPIPIHIGGESSRALDRAARLGEGWMGMSHTPESAASRAKELSRLRTVHGREDEAFEVTVMPVGDVAQDLAAWEEAGVDRLIVRPWTRSREVIGELEEFALDLDFAGPSERVMP
jgi:probable F420-dependent oxidoreductase